MSLYIFTIGVSLSPIANVGGMAKGINVLECGNKIVKIKNTYK